MKQKKEEEKKKEISNLSAKNLLKYSHENPNEIDNSNKFDYKRRMVKIQRKRMSMPSFQLQKENEFNKKNFFKTEKIDSKISHTKK